MPTGSVWSRNRNLRRSTRYACQLMLGSTAWKSPSRYSWISLPRRRRSDRASDVVRARSAPSVTVDEPVALKASQNHVECRAIVRVSMASTTSRASSWSIAGAAARMTMALRRGLVRGLSSWHRSAVPTDNNTAAQRASFDSSGIREQRLCRAEGWLLLRHVDVRPAYEWKEASRDTAGQEAAATGADSSSTMTVRPCSVSSRSYRARTPRRTFGSRLIARCTQAN